MIEPPSEQATPERAALILAQLTALSQELAGATRPAAVAGAIARALTELLHPDQLVIALLEADSNRLVIAWDRGAHAARTDDPLLQLALRRGPLLLPRDAAAAGDDAPADSPGSWIGVPLTAARRTIGAVSLGARRRDAFGPPDLALASAVVAQAAIALENARLLDLLSTGKREWEHTVDGIPQAICILDAHGVVRRANHAFAHLIDMPVTALPGRPWLGLVPPAWSEVVARVLAQPGSAQVELRSGDRVLLVSHVPMAKEDAGAAVLLFDDQTDKRRLQDQLIQSEKMSAMGQLIAGVAHDLNNPLASVVGFADFLVEAGEVPARMAEPLQVIRQEAERAATIVKNLLSFARRQEGERQVQAVGPILESTLALLRNQVMTLHVEAVLEVAPDLPDVEVNANQIKQVFVNLINNAAQAIGSSGRGGRVWITAKRWLDGVAVTVADDGPGIPDAIAQRVFEPFFTTKPEGEGTGLGLAISQGIVTEHGGRITLDSTTGAGASFTVELPGGTRGSRAPAEPAAGFNVPLRLLVVDDEPHILHYMRATLESWGHSVAVAGDGVDAIERAVSEPFDVIICDLRMPQLGGREMYERLAQEHPQVAERIIFATGDTVRGDTQHFLERIGRPVLHKPFTLAELRRVLGAVVPQPR
ncbi:MAG TPA: ATP-binding protein [Gemmatimonadales bacterium]|nr:ATP-binding protein [Gemmatimonadales bacterium]